MTLPLFSILSSTNLMTPPQDPATILVRANGHYAEGNYAEAAGLYEQLKRRLAEVFPETIDAYLYFKDPICDLIMRSARLWADTSGWRI